MQISLLYNVEHLDRRPLVKAVHAVAVGGHLEDAVDAIGIKDFVQKYAELLADELGLDSIEDVLYIRVKDIGQQINSWIENEGLYFSSVEEILGHLA